MKLVIQNGSRVRLGNEKWLATLATGLTERGHEVVVSVPAGPFRDALAGLGIRVAADRPRGDLDLVSAVAFSRWLGRERPDALLLTTWKRHALGAWAGRAAGVPRVVVRLGIVRSLRRISPNALAFRRWIDAMIVNAPEIRETWARSAPWFPAESVHLVLNGIRPREDDRAGLRTRLRAELGVASGAILVGGAGHLAHRKGFDLLLRALALAPGSELRAVIAGGGGHGEELRALAAELGVSGRVHWLGHRDDAADVVGGCDVFALPSRNEGMANVMLEAMAAGVPVVAADVSGVRRALGEEIGRPPAGWIVPAEDPAALAAGLAEAARGLTTGAAAARAEEAERRIRERFGVDRMVDECERILFGPAP